MVKVGVLVAVKVLVGVDVEVAVGTKTVWLTVLVSKAALSLQSIVPLLLMTAPLVAEPSTSILNPQVPVAPAFTIPRFQVMVLPINIPFGTVVQTIVEVSRSLSRTSVTVTPVAWANPSLL